MTLHTQSTAPAAVPNGAGRRSAAQSGPGAVNRSSVGAAKSDGAASRSAATPGGVTGRGAATSSDVPSRCAAPSGPGALWRAAGVASPVAVKSSDAESCRATNTIGGAGSGAAKAGDAVEKPRPTVFSNAAIVEADVEIDGAADIAEDGG